MAEQQTSVQEQPTARPVPFPARASAARAPRRSARLAGLAARAHPARRALTLATGIAAAVPVLAATVKAVRDQWVPGADQAIIATRAYDVFTSHPPLLGQYSLAGEVTGQVTHSLGPMLFWLLAVPSHFGSAAAMTWTMGIFNTLCIVGCVALARRRGGLVLMFAAALAIALMCQSLSAETFHDVWNPSAGMFPFTLEIFLVWSLACGEYRLLPLTMLVASFAVQAHLMFLPPTAGLLALGIGGLALALRHDRRAGARTTPGTDGRAAAKIGPAPPTRRALALWIAGAVAVLALCWSAPVVEELRESPGNMTLVARSASDRKTTLGASVGWHAVVRAVGVRPWWLYVPSEKWERKVDVRAKPAAHATYSALALLAALFGMLLVGLLRRRRDVASGALIGFVLCAALAAVAASTPTPRLLSATLGYTMWWGTQAGMWIWLMLAWTGWLGALHVLRSFAARRATRGSRRGTRRPSHRGAATASPPVRAPARSRVPGQARNRSSSSTLALVLACTGAVAATAAVGAAVAATGKPDEHAALYRPTKRLVARMLPAVRSVHTVELLGSLNIATMPIKPALRYYLVRHGVRALAPGSYLRLGSWYELYHRSYQEVLYVENGVRKPVPGVQLLDRVHFGTGWGPQTVSLWRYPHPGSGGPTATHAPKHRPRASHARRRIASG